MAIMRTHLCFSTWSLQLLLTLASPAFRAEQYPGYEVRQVLQEAGDFVRAAQEALGRRTEALQSPDEPSRPSVPHRFSSNITFMSGDLGFPSQGSGLFAQDADQKAMRVETMRPFDFVEGWVTNMTTLTLANASYDVTGGSLPVCRQLAMLRVQRFSDLFSWAANPLLSEYGGQHQVDGRQCSLWHLHAQNQSMTLCASGDFPVELNMSIFLKSSTGGRKFNTTYRFGPLNLGSEVPQFLFSKPSICGSLAPACENGRGLEPVQMDAYVFHPGLSAADYNLEDQNVADLAGDALFICMDRLRSQTTSFIDHNYSLISRYTLQVSPAFGQYGLCNGYPDTQPPGPFCAGGDPRLVGKERPGFVGDGEGRCAATSPIGFWLGLPKAGHCPPGQSPTKDAWVGGCTWSVQKRIKTIQQTCLLKDHDYLKFCKADFVEKRGFPRSMAALEAAFASEDPSKGGCKDVGGPHDQSESTFIV